MSIYYKFFFLYETENVLFCIYVFGYLKQFHTLSNQQQQHQQQQSYYW